MSHGFKMVSVRDEDETELDLEAIVEGPSASRARSSSQSQSQTQPPSSPDPAQSAAKGSAGRGRGAGGSAANATSASTGGPRRPKDRADSPSRSVSVSERERSPVRSFSDIDGINIAVSHSTSQTAIGSRQPSLSAFNATRATALHGKGAFHKRELSLESLESGVSSPSHSNHPSDFELAAKGHADTEDRPRHRKAGSLPSIGPIDAPGHAISRTNSERHGSEPSKLGWCLRHIALIQAVQLLLLIVSVAALAAYFYRRDIEQSKAPVPIDVSSLRSVLEVPLSFASMQVASSVPFQRANLQDRVCGLQADGQLFCRGMQETAGAEMLPQFPGYRFSQVSFMGSNVQSQQFATQICGVLSAESYGIPAGSLLCSQLTDTLSVVPVDASAYGIDGADVRFSSVAVGYSSLSAFVWFACAVASSPSAVAGRVFCLGSTVSGEVGFPSPLPFVGIASPAALPRSETFVSLSPGLDRICSVAQSGSVYCWGRLLSASQGAVRGNCGNETWTGGLTPLAGSRCCLSDVCFPEITASNGCGLSANTTECGSFYPGSTCTAPTGRGLYCDNPYRSYAFSYLSPSAAPRCSGVTPVCLGAAIQLPSALPVGDAAQGLRSVSVGDAHACGLDAAGIAYCWGSNWFGELGDGTFFQKLAPVRVSTTLSFQAIAAGDLCSCGLSDGDVYCWGRTTPSTVATAPLRLPALAADGSGVKLTKLTMNSAVVCGVDADGNAYCGLLPQQGVSPQDGVRQLYLRLDFGALKPLKMRSSFRLSLVSA